ncbi:MAG: rhodanese-like domain-containing protein [Candidatus Fimisoma sp.]
MGLRDLLRRTDINQAAELCREDETAVLLDVRTAEEYKASHIEGSINVPLQNIESIKQLIENLSAPIYAYCLSGARSRQAVSALRAMGYTNVSNAGGINGYRGRLAR